MDTLLLTSIVQGQDLHLAIAVFPNLTEFIDVFLLAETPLFGYIMYHCWITKENDGHKEALQTLEDGVYHRETKARDTVVWIDQVDLKDESPNVANERNCINMLVLHKYTRHGIGVYTLPRGYKTHLEITRMKTLDCILVRCSALE